MQAINSVLLFSFFVFSFSLLHLPLSYYIPYFLFKYFHTFSFFPFISFYFYFSPSRVLVMLGEEKTLNETEMRWRWRDDTSSHAIYGKHSWHTYSLNFREVNCTAVAVSIWIFVVYSVRIYIVYAVCVYLMEVLSIEFVHIVLTFQAIANNIVLYGCFMCDYGIHANEWSPIQQKLFIATEDFIYVSFGEIRCCKIVFIKT